jgi:protoheme IX farnesyltransferase
LTKPRLLPLVLFSGLPVMGMGSAGWPSASIAVLALAAVAFAAASANSLNAYVECDLDARMARTRSRPLPSGRLSRRAALRFGLALALLATGLLAGLGGWIAAALGISSILFYVFVYTLWAKPRSAWNVLVGGVAGAASPLLADAALGGGVGLAGLLLFAIVFCWQPPHVWAITLYRKHEYAAAGIPTLPARLGDEATRWWMLAGTLVLVPVTLGPWLAGLAGGLYASVALVAGAAFVASAVAAVRARSDESARRVFAGSLVHLVAVFGALLADLVIA